jgi:hypothetical protein
MGTVFHLRRYSGTTRVDLAMRPHFHLMALVITLAGCQSNDPVERQADTYEPVGRNQADAIRDEAKSRASDLENRAAEIDKNADAVGGFNEKKLDVRADALRSEAGIVKDQGEARADAVQAAADAKAKELRAK